MLFRSKGAAKAFLQQMLSEEYGKKIEAMGYGVASKLTAAAKATHTK